MRIKSGLVRLPLLPIEEERRFDWDIVRVIGESLDLCETKDERNNGEGMRQGSSSFQFRLQNQDLTFSRAEDDEKGPKPSSIDRRLLGNAQSHQM
jgi:hypothetical protein